MVRGVGSIDVGTLLQKVVKFPTYSHVTRCLICVVYNDGKLHAELKSAVYDCLVWCLSHIPDLIFYIN